MQRAIVVIAVLMCAGYSFGQGNGLPQWKVIKEIHLIGQTATIPTTILFIPTKDDLYRASIYISMQSTQLPQGAGWNVTFSWVDGGSDIVDYRVTGVELNNGRNDHATIDPFLFRPEAATAIQFQLIPTDPPPHDATYDLAITIEQLTH